MSELRVLERRFAPAEGLELRESSDGKLEFSGYAAVWDSPYDMGKYTEVVRRGAFAKTLSVSARPGYSSERDIAFCAQHDPATVMARTSNGTLRLSEDDHGLKVEANLDPSDVDVQRIAPKLRNGNIYQMSHARVTRGSEWDREATPQLRSVTEAELFEVSPVTFPASPQTTAELRAALASLQIDADNLGVEMSELLTGLRPEEERVSSLDEAIDALLAHAKGRTITPDQASEARTAVEALRSLFADDSEHLQPEGAEHLHSLRIAHATTRIRRYQEVS